MVLNITHFPVFIPRNETMYIIYYFSKCLLYSSPPGIVPWPQACSGLLKTLTTKTTLGSSSVFFPPNNFLVKPSLEAK